jgi:hypothetical protein
MSSRTLLSLAASVVCTLLLGYFALQLAGVGGRLFVLHSQGWWWPLVCLGFTLMAAGLGTSLHRRRLRHDAAID